MSATKSVFSITIKAIAFAWQTSRKLFLLLIALNFFLGAIVYLQFTSFSKIVDGIVAIKQGSRTMENLIFDSIVLGLSFLIPTLVSNFVSFARNKFRLDQDLHLDLYKIERQGSLDIGTIESNTYQTLLRSAQEWGTGSVLSLQDFVFSSASNFAGIITSMVILGRLANGLYSLLC